MDVLRIDGIRKSFRGDLSLARREVLHGVSLTAREGEILGFLGPNGAGKTTTIKIVLGLIRPDSGSVTVFGRSIRDETVKALIGYMPETPYFYPHLSLREFLTFCGRMSGMKGDDLERRLDAVTEALGLAPSVRVRLKDFSKGMIQRAGLAQAILHDPALLILDEPFSGLDPVGRLMLRDILLDLKKKGKTIFFSSHILPDMEVLCDRTCIIRDGMIVRCIGLDELIRIGERKVMVTARDCRPGVLEGIEGYIDSVSTTDEEMFLVVREQKYVRTVIQHLYNRGVEVLRVANRHASLEEIFINEISGDHETPVVKEPEEELTFTGF